MRPALLDSLVALAVLAVGLSDLFQGDDRRASSLAEIGHRAPTALLIASVVGQGLPMVWRRRAPSAVLAAVLACCVFQWSLGTVVRSAIALLIALYSLARYGRLKALPWATLGTAAGLAVAAFRAVPFDVDEWTSLFFLYGTATAAVALALFVRVRQAQLAVLADTSARLEVEREQRVRLAMFAERSRMSREMHDVAGHSLAVIIGLADGAAYGASVDPGRSQEVFGLIASTGRQALSEVRRTLSALRLRPDQEGDVADLHPQPGLADVGALLERIQAAGPRITYRTAGDLDAVPPGIGLAAYRIIQESLTNSLKHAGPTTTVHVTAHATDDEVRLLVDDTGCPDGSPPRKTSGHEGQGLVGISERAALAGGGAEAGPSEAGGWTVRAVFPLHRLDAPKSSQPSENVQP